MPGELSYRSRNWLTRCGTRRAFNGVVDPSGAVFTTRPVAGAPFAP
jgi:hypothetical protein